MIFGKPLDLWMIEFRLLQILKNGRSKTPPRQGEWMTSYLRVILSNLISHELWSPPLPNAPWELKTARSSLNLRPCRAQFYWDYQDGLFLESQKGWARPAWIVSLPRWRARECIRISSRRADWALEAASAKSRSRLPKSRWSSCKKPFLRFNVHHRHFITNT